MENSTTEPEQKFREGGEFKAYHSDFIFKGGDYGINAGAIGHRVRVEYDGVEVANETSIDRAFAEQLALTEVRKFKAKTFPEQEEEFPLEGI